MRRTLRVTKTFVIFGRNQSRPSCVTPDAACCSGRLTVSAIVHKQQLVPPDARKREAGVYHSMSPPSRPDQPLCIWACKVDNKAGRPFHSLLGRHVSPPRLRARRFSLCKKLLYLTPCQRGSSDYICNSRQHGIPRGTLDTTWRRSFRNRLRELYRPAPHGARGVPCCT
jgi:hypothetical protein